MKFILTILFSLFLTEAFSQASDFVIKHNGDTIWGKVRLRNGIFHVGNDQIVQLNAREVRKIMSDHYKGTIVVPCSLILYSDNIDELQLNYFKQEAVDTVMILSEVYTTPKINLYYGVSDFKIPFYFYKTPADSLPVQLVVRYYFDGGLANQERDPGKYRGERANIGLVEDKGYVNQLYAIMGKCKKISPGTWELLSYREYSFKELFRKYNKCK